MEHDLSLVMPERQGETLRRIAVVQRFLASPGRRAAEAAAVERGLGVAQFYNIARAWRELGRPEAVAGSGRPTRRRLGLSGAQAALVDAVIDAAPGQSARALIAAVGERATREGVALPHSDMLSRYVWRGRSRTIPLGEVPDADIAIDHTVIDLPVVFGERPATRPLVTFAIDLRGQVIAGVALSDGRPSPASAAAALLTALRRSAHERAGRPIELRVAYRADHGADWSALDVAMADGGLQSVRLDAISRPPTRLAEALLGRTHAGLTFRPRLVKRDPAERLPTGWLASRRPLTADAATAMVAGRLVATSGDDPFGGLDKRRRRALDQALVRVAGEGP